MLGPRLDTATIRLVPTWDARDHEIYEDSTAEDAGPPRTATPWHESDEEPATAMPPPHNDTDYIQDIRHGVWDNEWINPELSGVAQPL